MKIFEKSQIDEIASLLRSGAVLAFPTETVFGLGVVFDNQKAYEDLVRVKNRAPNKPFTLMCGSIEDIEKYATIDSHIRNVIDKYMPGELTIVLKANDNVPSWVTLNTGTIGIRVSSASFISSLIKKVGKPLLVPSANKANEKPASTVDEVINIFDTEIAGVVKGSIVSNTPSTVIDLTKTFPVLLRQGIIEFGDIVNIWSK